MNPRSQRPSLPVVCEIDCTTLTCIVQQDPKNPLSSLMSNHSLVSLTVPVACGLCPVNDVSHLLLLLVRERYVPRGKVVGEPMGLGRAWNGNHALGCNPCERNLAQAASAPVGELLNLVGDCSVLVECFSLELGDFGTGR